MLFRSAFVEFGTMDTEAYRFPENVGSPHSSGLFVPRPYEHTSFHFRMSGSPYGENVWTEFAGDTPQAFRGTPCLLIGLAQFRPALAAYLQRSVEAIAIIPATDHKPDMTRALVAPVFPETGALLETPAPPQ